MHIRSCDTAAMYFRVLRVVNIFAEFVILTLCIKLNSVPQRDQYKDVNYASNKILIRQLA